MVPGGVAFVDGAAGVIWNSARPGCGGSQKCDLNSIAWIAANFGLRNLDICLTRMSRLNSSQSGSFKRMGW